VIHHYLSIHLPVIKETVVEKGEQQMLKHSPLAAFTTRRMQVLTWETFFFISRLRTQWALNHDHILHPIFMGEGNAISVGTNWLNLGNSYEMSIILTKTNV